MAILGNSVPRQTLLSPSLFFFSFSSINSCKVWYTNETSVQRSGTTISLDTSNDEDENRFLCNFMKGDVLGLLRPLTSR